MDGDAPRWPPPAAPPYTPLATRLYYLAEAELILLILGVVSVLLFVFVPACVLIFKRLRRQRERQLLIDETFNNRL